MHGTSILHTLKRLVPLVLIALLVAPLAHWRPVAARSATPIPNLQPELAANQPPRAPTLLAPAQGSRLSGTSVTFQWQDNGDPDNAPSLNRTFLVELLRDGQIVHGYDFDWVTGTSYTIRNLSVGSYQWRMRSSDTAAQSDWTVTWSFTLGNAPFAFYCDNKGPDLANSCFTRFVSGVSTWTSITTGSSYGGQADAVHNRFNTGSITNADAARWRPNIAQAGNYDVSIWYPQITASATSSARYEINDANGQRFVTWNQASNPGRWNRLTTMYCTVGTACSVRLMNTTQESSNATRVLFDAVRFVQVPPAPTTFSISGRVTTNTGALLSGVAISDGTRTAITNSNGDYMLTNVPVGSYTLTPSRSGYTFSPSALSVSVNGHVNGQNFTATPIPTTFSISGRVTTNTGALLSGVAISDGTHTAITNSNGDYMLTNVPVGSYTLTPSRSGYTFSPAARSVSVNGHVNGQNFTATPIPTTFSISGRVTTNTGALLSGVAISDGTRTAITNSNGDYMLTNVPVGSYTLTPSRIIGYSFSPPKLTGSVSGNVTGRNFMATPYTIRGRVTTNTGAGLSGVTISDGTRTVTTDNNGDYIFSNVSVGSYILTPSRSGYTFSPTSLRVSIIGHVSGQNFTATSIADTTEPDGRITSLQDGQTFTTGPITLAADASDNPGGSGIARVEFKVDHTGIWREAGTVSQSPYTVQWNPPAGLAAQQLRFSIHVFDRAGNQRIDAGGIRVVNYKPVVPIDNGSQELPPTNAHQQLLPDLREFQFGTQVSTSPVEYRSGRIEFNLPITRYYGYFGTGNENFTRLVDQTAYLTLRVFDVDPLQRNEVWVNGCRVTEQLKGQNNRWDDITIQFPSSCLKFPNATSLNENRLDQEDIPYTARLTPANNAITVVIDRDNRGYKSHVAWARITVGGVRPVLYVHGFDPSCSDDRTRALGKIREFLNGEGIPNLGARNDGTKYIETQAGHLHDAYVEMQRIYGLRPASASGVTDPDRILLLGHSMGGLTGRRFVNLQHSSSGNPIIERFVALATPNNGSWAVLGADALTFEWDATCNDQAARDLWNVQDKFNPANNLSQSWSNWPSRYGGSASSASSVEHMISIAAMPKHGDWRDQVTPRTDGVVHADSAFSLDYDNDKEFHCLLGWWFECTLYVGGALHNKIVEFRNVYEFLKPIMGIGQIVTSREALGRTATAGLATEAQVAELAPTQEQAAEFATIFTQAGMLNAGTGQSVSFTVDPMRQLLVSVRTEATDLAFALRSPSGTLTQAEGGFVSIANPEVGTWQVVLAAPSQTTTYQIVAEGDADLVITPDSQAQIVRGTSGQLAVIVRDGSAGRSGLSVTGQVRLPGAATPSTLTFSPDPQQSGRYVASVNPSQLGPILATVQISGQRASGASFTRETLLASLAIAGGIIDPNFREITGEDSSNDGLYNRLQVTFRLNLPSAGTYRVSAGLQRVADGQGFAASQTTVNGTAGNNTVTLSFDGSYLGALNFNEQVRLAFVQVSAEDGTVLDVRIHVGANFTLQSSQFQRPLLRATISDATPVDLDGNGRFDELVFTGQFITEVADSFTIEASLIDPQGQPFSFSAQTQELAVGTHTLRIPFRGVDVTAQGQSGEFTLSDVVITPQTLEQVPPLRLQNAFRTAELQSSAFAQAARLTLSSNISVARAVVRVLPDTSNHVFAQGQEVTLEVVKLDEMVNFLGWRVDGEMMSTPNLSITMDRDRTVEAIFTQTVYLPLMRR